MATGRRTATVTEPFTFAGVKPRKAKAPPQSKGRPSESAEFVAGWVQMSIDGEDSDCLGEPQEITVPTERVAGIDVQMRAAAKRAERSITIQRVPAAGGDTVTLVYQTKPLA